MHPLPVPLPACFEEVVGWTAGDEARWLSGFWTSLGDHPYLSDGRSSMSGHAWGWLAWARHPKVAPHLAHLDLGSSEMEGPHALLFETIERRVYACDRAEAQRVVRGQWPPQEPVQLTQEDLDAVVEHVRRAWLSRPLPSTEQLMAAMRRHSALVAELVAYLDAWVPGREDKP